MLAPAAMAIDPVNLLPDSTAIIGCNYCSFGNQTNITDSMVINCVHDNSTCPTYNNTLNGTCYVDYDLIGGEKYNNTDGPCDVHVSCTSKAKFQDFKYPTTIAIQRDNNTLDIGITVLDPNEEEFMTWTKSLVEKDIVDLKYGFDFQCPHEVISDVNLQTCQEYLDPILGEQNPMIYALATGQNDCVSKLTNCTAQLVSCRNSDEKYEFKYIETKSSLDVCNARKQELEYELSDPNGQCMENVNEVQNKIRGEANLWFTTTIILGICVVIFVIYKLNEGESL